MGADFKGSQVTPSDGRQITVNQRVAGSSPAPGASTSGVRRGTGRERVERASGMSGIAIDLAAIVIAVLVLVTIANRIGVPYPILLVIGGIGLGYFPGVPALEMPPSVVLLVFLPGLLYW